MKICFVMPKFTRQPIGGYKMIFEYANRFVEHGDKVTLAFVNDDALAQFSIPSIAKNWISFLLTKIEPKWFPLNKTIKKISIIGKEKVSKISDVDVLIATGYQTVEIVKAAPGDIRKIYFIQGYETWNTTESYINRTFAYGFKNIVVANWLKEIVQRYSVDEVTVIQNPIDTGIYRVTNPIENRKKHTISLLYHKEKIKGIKYAMAALYSLKEKYSDLEVQMFGMFPEPDGLPDWINYTRGATQKQTVEIYNNSAVFLCASVEEGFGLTGYEAMACGAALVSTSYKGVLEYAVDKFNALLSAVKQVDDLVNNVTRIFEDNDLRIRIASNGVSSVSHNNWENAVLKFKNTFCSDTEVTEI